MKREMKRSLKRRENERAWAEHVKHWRDRIKKHGGFEGAYREGRQLWESYSPEMQRWLKKMAKQQKARP
jgi:hypothetical protein